MRRWVWKGIGLLGLVAAVMAQAQRTPAPAETDAGSAMAAAVRSMWPAGMITTENKPGEWAYEEGVLLDGMTAQWWTNASGVDFAYVRAAVDKYIGPDGSIKGYQANAHSLDNIEMGRAVLMLYRVTQAKKYALAAKFLRDQLRAQPRTASGAFWHKQIYPNQVWLDGAYMAGPFLAAYGATFQSEADLDEVAHELLLMDTNMRDLETGLMRHGWDESRIMPWADKGTGLSPEVWARAMGWYAMALVDVLDWTPPGYAHRRDLIEALNRTLSAAMAYQDKDSGLWWQVMDKAAAAGNFPEASGSCMFVYALAKGVRMGYVSGSDLQSAQRAWAEINRRFVHPGPNGAPVLSGTVKSAGLGGKPYRSGSFDYYIHEPVIDNDAKGVGAYLMAASEMQQAATALSGQGIAVLLDAWFNSQMRSNALGQRESFHYKWTDDADSGFSFFGRAFSRYGVRLDTLPAAPTAEALGKAQIYVMASPDTREKNPTPHVVDPKSIDAIEAWVRAGGVLVLLQNDGPNAEFEHFNQLGERFGMHFNPVVRNHVEGTNFEQGAVPIPAGTGVFSDPHHAFMKDTCTLTLNGSARAIVTKGEDVMVAVAGLGKGTVIAAVDPWFYNEYTDGRKLPAAFDNDSAAKDLVRWLLAKTR